MLRTPNKLVCAAFHFQLELSFPSVTLGQIQELSNRDYRFQIILQMTEDTFLPFLVKPFACFVLSYHTNKTGALRFFIKPLPGFILSLCIMSSFHKAALDYPVDKHFASSTSYWT